MMAISRVGIVFALAASVFGTASAADLAPGDKAPALTVSHWLKGNEVKEFKSGHVYVVEFWATWCGPCIVGMPHISELQAKFKDKVTIIGVNAFERGSLAETNEKVKKFVADQGDKMAYTVVRDNEKGEMAANWMTAAKQNGIPCAFVVDQKGTVVWIGHPGMMDEVLAEVVEGRFDVEKSKKDFTEKVAATEQRMAANRRLSELDKMYKEGKKEEAIKGLDDLEKEVPAQKQAIRVLKVNLFMSDDFPKAEKIVRDEMKADAGNALNMFLFNVLMTPRKVKDGDAAAYDKLNNDLIAHLESKGAEGDYILPLNLAMACINLKKYDKAIALAEEGQRRFEADPKRNEALRERFDAVIKQAKEAKAKAEG